MEKFFSVKLGLKLVLTSGYQTSQFRKELNKGKRKKDPKVKNKGSLEFNAHCIDSYVLGCPKGTVTYLDEEGNEVVERVLMYTPKVNKRVVYIEKIEKVRRCLTRTRKLYNDKGKYYKLGKGGVKNYYKNKSKKRNVCRVKPEGVHSNHPKEWVTVDNGYAEKGKYNTARYGGTVMNGVKKFYHHNEWHNRTIEVRYG